MSTYTDTKKFLQAVFGDDWETKAFLVNSPNWGVRLRLDQLDNTKDCYWCVGAIPWGKARKNSSVENVRALVIDDVGTKVDAAKVEAAFGRPTAVVITSPGNFQWSYRLSEPVAVGAWSSFFRGAEAAIRNARALEGRDAAHLFRLPMGVNTKPDYDAPDVAMDALDPGVTSDVSTVTPAGGEPPSGGGSSEPEPRIKNIKGLLRLVPNNDEPYDAWIARAHQVKALALDEVDGAGAFDEWSRKSGKYDADETGRRWATVAPSRTAGLILLADAERADPAGFADIMNGEARTAFDDGADHPPPPPKGGGGGYRPNHVNAAEAVVLAARGRLGWLSNASHRWAAYDEVMGRWEIGDDDAEMRTAARLEIERRLKVGVGTREAVEMHRAGWRGAVQSLLVREKRLRLVAGRFDADHDVVGVPGGVLRLGRAMGLSSIEAGRPDHMVSKTLAVRPSGSPHPVWDRFLADFTMGDASLALWWQAFCGYCLTGHTIEQLVVFLYGPGGNGKSVFLDIIGEVMGDYHVRADHRLFMAKVGNFHLSPLAALEGARLVTCPDVGTGAAWDVGLVKALTGGGLITANRMRENSFSFEPQCKVVLAGNEKPRLDNVDAGVKRRFLLIPATAVPRRVDKGLMEKLRAERDGILDWMLRGWSMWALGGLPVCGIIERETASYLEGADVFGRWMRETLSVNPSDRTRHRISDLWVSWDAFRMGEGAFKNAPHRKEELSTKLREAGFNVDRDNKGGYVDGVTVKKISVF